MAGIDTNRGTTGIVLPAEVSNEVFSLTIEQSAVMQAARKVPVPGPGVQIDMITGLGDAAWVNETDEKPVGKATFANKVFQAYTLALIMPFSNQFKRDKAALYREIIRLMPLELARKFDSTVFGTITKPGSTFDQLNTAQTLTVDPNNPLPGLLAARGAIGGRPTNVISSPEFETLLLGATYDDGRPMFFQDPTKAAGVGSILGAGVLPTSGDMVGSATAGDDLAIMGDFANHAMWGSVEGIQYSESDQSTLNIGGTQVNLWQRNMFAVRFEIELAFAVRDMSKFVRLTNGVVDADTKTAGRK